LHHLASVRSLDDCTEYARSVHQAASKGAAISDFPVVTNEPVKEFIQYFQVKREFMEKSLERSGQYVPMMQKVFKENGLPEDLVYLSLIESGFKTHAYSRARACGPWQFMRATGRRYGLRVDIWVDERRDPEKATRAAAAYLKDLYEMFGDWYLAVAAYNAGENKILKATKRYHTTDFWAIRKKYYLKKETRDYVPKLMAAILIAKNPEEYGFGGIVKHQPVPLTTVEIPNPTELKFIARLAGISESELKSYNPELRKWCTPARAGGYSIKVPRANAQIFARNFERNKDKFLTASAFHKHRIRRGETLYEIARQYNTKVAHIQKMNGIRNPRLIHPGNVLIIPVPPIVSSS
jgi:membrane-bound lytic murein transglycosylase D